MARATNNPASHRRRKKLLKAASGYFSGRHRLFQNAKETLRRAGNFAFRDRRAQKRVIRKMWIARINAACRNNGIAYSRLINGLSLAGIEIDRKMLAEVAINDPAGFTAIVEKAREGLKKSSDPGANRVVPAL